LQYRSDIPAVNQFEESNELVPVISTDEIASVNKSRVISSNLVECLSKMRILPALTDWALILNSRDSMNHLIAKLLNSNFYPALL
jgi:hypothetical protein